MRNVRFGPRDVAFPSDRLGVLRDCSHLVDHDAGARGQALRQRLAEDGYLLIRGLLDRRQVLHSRARILEHMQEAGAIAPGSPIEEGRIATGAQAPWMAGRAEITHHDAVRATLESPALFDFFDQLFGTRAMTLDHKWLRATDRDEYTGAHCDVVYMGRGSERLTTCWIPIGDISVEHGSLAICVGSHRLDGFAPLRATYGQLDVDRDDTQGWFTDDPLEVSEQFGGTWCTSDVEAGDVLVFGMHTMHASTTNTTDRYRISCDVRFQPADDDVDERWVGDDPMGHPGYPWSRSMSEARADWGL